MFNTKTTRPVWEKYSNRFSLSASMAPIKTKTNKIVESILKTFSILLVKYKSDALKIIPSKTGRVTIKNILIAMPVRDIEPRAVSDTKPIDIPKTIGTDITLNKLITAVSEIDKATSPLANEVKIFDVTPPGAAAINIKPIASSGCSGHTNIISKATSGKKINWLIIPIRKFFGLFATFTKSAKDRPKPRVNIINARAKGRTTSVMKFIS